MTNKDLLMKFKDEFPFAKVSDFRPICHELFTDGKQGITIWLEDGSVVEYYPNTKDDNERMTKNEAIKILEYALECVDEETPKGADEAEAIPMAIEALKAQDRPIICPRCGRTFSEAEGRESKEIQGLEYAENILENILREQEGSEE